MIAPPVPTSLGIFWMSTPWCVTVISSAPISTSTVWLINRLGTEYTFLRIVIVLLLDTRRP